MDKYEYRVKTEQMLEHMENKRYKKAMEIADTIDWRRVKNPSILHSVSEIYEYCGEFQKSRDVLFVAYDRAPNSRKTVYRLGTLALKINDIEEASDCYEEFVKLAPKDPNQFILKYKILKARRASLADQIEALEEFKKAEYLEKWAYELAKLYDLAGMTAKCLEECDDLILWFSEGRYVYQAMELKMKYKPLTPLQQEKYNSQKGGILSSAFAAEEPKAAAVPEEEASAGESVEDIVARMMASVGGEISDATNPDMKPVMAEEDEKAPETDEEEFGSAERNMEGVSSEGGEEEASEEELKTRGESNIRQTVKGATLAEALRNGFAVANGIDITPKAKAIDKRDEDLRITGQMKIEEILMEWEAKQKENARAILDQRKRDEEARAREKEEAEKRREEEARRIEKQQRAAEEARLHAEQKAAEEKRRLAARKAEEERILAEQKAEEERRQAILKAEEEERRLERLAADKAVQEAEEEFAAQPEDDMSGFGGESEDVYEDISGEAVGEQPKENELLYDYDADEDLEEFFASQEELQESTGMTEDLRKLMEELELDEDGGFYNQKEKESGKDDYSARKAMPKKAAKKTESVESAYEDASKEKYEADYGEASEDAQEAAAYEEASEDRFEGAGYEEASENKFEEGGYEEASENEFEEGGYEEASEDEFEETAYEKAPEDEFEEGGYGEASENEFEKAGYEEASEDEFEEAAYEEAPEDEFEEAAYEEASEDEFEEAAYEEASEDEFEEAGYEEALEDGFEEAGYAEVSEDEYEEAGFGAEEFAEKVWNEAGGEYPEDEFEDESYEDFSEDDFVGDYEDEFSKESYEDDYEDELDDLKEDAEEEPVEEEPEEEAVPEEEPEPATSKTKKLKKQEKPEDLRIEEPTEEEIQKRIRKGKGGVPFDTGFVVTGRYDLSATSEIGLRAGLTEEQKKLFSYFVPVRGMSEQIVEVLDNDRREKREGTSRTGNIIVMGQKGSGKTVLAVDIVKAIQKQRNLKQGKVAIVTGESLNKKELGTIIQKLRGGAIIIEKAGKLNTRTIRELNHLMEKKTGELLVVLEDQKKPLEKIFTANPSFKKKFTSKLELPPFINDELVTFGQTYAKESGYKLDEMGILALYSRIDVMQREDHSVTVAEVKEIMDEAIEHSKKANVKHFARRVFGKGTDDSDRIILKEDDFRI